MKNTVRYCKNRGSKAPQSVQINNNQLKIESRSSKIALRSSFGVIFDEKERPRASKSVSRASQERPRAHQERPKSVPEWPKSVPRAPKRAPRAAKRRPREAQGLPERPPRESKKGPKCDPRGIQAKHRKNLGFCS